MLSRLFQHLRRNLVAYLALFVALSSTGYAASTKLMPKNSVGSAQVINRSLLRVDFKPGQLVRGPRGLAGRVGPAGTPGAPGTPGPPAPLTTYHYRSGGIASGTSVARAFCVGGEKVTGGGGVSTDMSPVGITQSFPISDTSGANAWGTTAIGWQVASEGFGGVQAFVICASQP